MKPIRLYAALLSMSASLACAAPAAYLTLDHSSSQLIDPATAQAQWRPILTARLMRLYPVKKWGFVSEVEGGFDEAKVCVITARAMMLPRSGTALLFRPAKTATAFGTQAGATADQCKALAKSKLTEAVEAVTASLMSQ